MLLNLLTVFIAYFFSCLIAKETPIYPNTPETVIWILVIVILSGFAYQAFYLYKPSVYFKTSSSILRILEANVTFFGTLAIIFALFAEPGIKSFLLIWTLMTLLVSTAFLTFKRRILLVVLRVLRAKQYILRKVIIVGDNTASAKEYVRQIEKNPQCGMMVLGYVGNKISEDVGCDKLGAFTELEKILDEYKPTDVVFAIDSYDKRHLIRLVNICDDRCIKVFFLPVIYGFFKTSRQLEQIGSLPIINIHTTPLDNRANAAVKRIVDIIGSLALIILTSPLMIMAAIGTKISSPGPIFFRQQRVGKLGKPFTMLKFRSMRVNDKSTVAWTTGTDPRKTRFGTFLRRTAIDELPQLFNVLLGSMSLVGPRPELPAFVEVFRKDIPLYMVKHYVKPGLTGLAQVKGLRGDTSVVDRIHEDIDYIENWSLWLDIYILLCTPFKAFNKNEKYVDTKKEQAQVAEAPASRRTEEHSADDVVITSGGVDVVAKKAADENKSYSARVNDDKSCKILYAASTYSHLKSFHIPYIEALRREGYTVMTMAKGEGADFDIPFVKKTFSKENAACRKMIREIAEREKFDLVILNTSLAAFHIRMALPKKDRPRVVNIVHGYLFSNLSSRGAKEKIKSRLLLLAEKLTAKKTDAILTMNAEDFDIATDNKLSLSQPISTLGMGISELRVRVPRDVFRERNKVADKYVLLFVGELSARKNQSFLISSMPAILSIRKDAVLWLVGEGDERSNLEHLAVDLGVSERVRFFGRRDNVSDYLSAADVYVSASKIEGLPFNIVEALGAGCPVLASDIKGHRDILCDGAGRLYECGSMKHFVEGFVAIAEEKRLPAAETVRKAYDKYSFSSVFADTYEKIKKAGNLE